MAVTAIGTVFNLVRHGNPLNPGHQIATGLALPGTLDTFTILVLAKQGEGWILMAADMAFPVISGLLPILIRLLFGFLYFHFLPKETPTVGYRHEKLTPVIITGQ